MKKFLLKFLILFFILVIIPSIRSMSYDGPVFKETIPKDEESRSIDYRHDSVKWGGPGNLACASYLSVWYRDRYHKDNRTFISDTTTSYRK